MESFPHVSVRNNQDIRQISHTTLKCPSKHLKEVLVRFILKWPQRSIEDDAGNFSDATFNYVNYLKEKHIGTSMNLTILSAMNRFVGENEIELKLKFNCDDKSLKKCTDAVSEVLENFKSFDLMVLYHDEGIEMSVNTGEWKILWQLI